MPMQGYSAFSAPPAAGSSSFRGCSATKSADQTAINATGSVTTISWNSEDYDTDAIHDNSTNPSRLTVPSGVSYVRVHANIRFNNGMIIWHDYHDLGTVDVRDVLHDLSDQGRKIVQVEGTWIAFERVR